MRAEQAVGAEPGEIPVARGHLAPDDIDGDLVAELYQAAGGVDDELPALAIPVAADEQQPQLVARTPFDPFVNLGAGVVLAEVGAEGDDRDIRRIGAVVADRGIGRPAGRIDRERGATDRGALEGVALAHVFAGEMGEVPVVIDHVGEGRVGAERDRAVGDDVGNHLGAGAENQVVGFAAHAPVELPGGGGEVGGFAVAAVEFPEQPVIDLFRDFQAGGAGFEREDGLDLHAMAPELREKGGGTT